MKGFSLVEIIIVLVIIMVLAAIALPYYFGLQHRARDAKRKSDIAQFVRALEIYKIENKHYPQANPNPQRDYWSDSDLSPRDYIKDFDSFTDGMLPIDPLNNETYHYSYQVFEGENFGCKKTFYILGVRKFEVSPKMGGFRCPQRDFVEEFDWALGGYE